MASDQPLAVAFLWHMHQPDYREPQTGAAVLPWVRLHATKDYLDMLLWLERFPTLSLTFNFTPCLLEQIRAYASGTFSDLHFELSRKSPAELTRPEKLQALDFFFQLPLETMVKPYRRFHQLWLAKNHFRHPEQALVHFSPQEWLDLQVWANLTWIDPAFRTDPELSALFYKAENFTAADKHLVLQKQQEIIGQIIPTLKRLLATGRLEITFSPFNHPILPLLMDLENARESQPNAGLPALMFNWPEDAEAQISKACNLYENLFGQPLRGMWPSEGAVCQALIPLFAKHRIRWIATDEWIWHNSAKSESPILSEKTSAKPYGTKPDLYQPWLAEQDGQQVALFFRDQILSDRIGFVYHAWEPDKAASDFIDHLHQLRKRLQHSSLKRAIVPIILDGENAWEYFPDDGNSFLESLYNQLTTAPLLRTTSFSAFLNNHSEPPKIKKLFAGSWVGHDFHIWIGEPHTNRAWDYLAQTRADLEHYCQNQVNNSNTAPEAWRHLYVAEGSDWFWWYSSQHQGRPTALFDKLFRAHLMEVYRLIDQIAPVKLLEPIFSPDKAGETQRAPSQPIRPVIDGHLTHFYEWAGAGDYSCITSLPAMHRGQWLLSHIYYGFDEKTFYIRCDFNSGIMPEQIMNLYWQIEIWEPRRLRITNNRSRIELLKPLADLRWEAILAPDVIWQIGSIVEIALPLHLLDTPPSQEIAFSIALKDKAGLAEIWPQNTTIRVLIPREPQIVYWEA